MQMRLIGVSGIPDRLQFMSILELSTSTSSTINTEDTIADEGINYKLVNNEVFQSITKSHSCLDMFAMKNPTSAVLLKYHMLTSHFIVESELFSHSYCSSCKESNPRKPFI